MDAADLSEFIQSVAQRTISVEDITTWLKVVHSNGISTEETTVLTEGMMRSGAVLQWEGPQNVVDKHSTGGVGDKMSLILAPALVACGMQVPMLAGRGLGHTGGTIDKLESIPGFKCELSPLEMRDAVKDVGCCIAAQNDAIAPADGLLYAIRDVTNTVDSIPLITASIVSKKAAEGLNALVLDVKCGSAAFMKNERDALALAESMVATAKGLGIDTVAQITDMNEPIGNYVGNSLEVLGSLLVLQGKGSSDTRELVCMQGGQLLELTGYADSLESGWSAIADALDNGSALDVFAQMCIRQGCDQTVVQRLIQEPQQILPKPARITALSPRHNGCVQSIDAMALAEVARELGAGRFALDDVIEPAVGYVLNVHKGDNVSIDEPWIEVHHNRTILPDQMEKIHRALHVTDQPAAPLKRLIRTVR